MRRPGWVVVGLGLVVGLGAGRDAAAGAMYHVTLLGRAGGQALNDAGQVLAWESHSNGAMPGSGEVPVFTQTTTLYHAYGPRAGAVDRIGESLVRSGTLSLEALRLAERSFAPGVRFGKVLVELGHVSPRELWHGVKFQVEEIVRSLFSYTDGAVYFFDGEVKPDNVVRLSLPTERLVAEGM